MSTLQERAQLRSVSPGLYRDHAPGRKSQRTAQRPSSRTTTFKGHSPGRFRPKMSMMTRPSHAHVRRSYDVSSAASSPHRPIPSPVPPTSPVIYPSGDSPPMVIRTLVQGPQQRSIHQVQQQLRSVSSAIDLRTAPASPSPAGSAPTGTSPPNLALASRHRAVYSASTSTSTVFNKRVLAPPRRSSQLSPPSSRSSSPHGSPTGLPPRRLSSCSTPTATSPESDRAQLSDHRADTLASGNSPRSFHAGSSALQRPPSAQFFAPPQPTHNHHRLQSESMIPGYSATSDGDFIEHPDPPHYHQSHQHATYPGANFPSPTPTPPLQGSAFHRSHTTPHAYRDSNFSDIASTIAPTGQRSSVLSAGRTGASDGWVTTAAISGSPYVPLDKLPEDWRVSFIPVIVSKQARDNLRMALGSFLDEPHVRENYAVELFVHKDDESVLYVCHRGTRRERLLSGVDGHQAGARHERQSKKEQKGRTRMGRPRANTGASTTSFVVVDDSTPQPVPRACCWETAHHSLDILLSDCDASSGILSSLIHLVPRPIAMPLTAQVDKDTKNYLIASFILRPELHAVCYPTNAPVFLDHKAARSPLLIPGQPHQPMPVGCKFAPKAKDLQVWLRIAVQSMKQNGTWGRVPVDEDEELRNVCCTIM